MYGLAAREEKDENSERFMNIARGITNTCHESYIRSDTKLGPGRARHKSLGQISFHPAFQQVQEFAEFAEFD